MVTVHVQPGVAPHLRTESKVRDRKWAVLFLLRAGSSKLRNISPSTRHTLDYSTPNIPTSRPSARGTNRWRIFVNRSFSLWDTGNCLNIRIPGAGGKAMKKSQDFQRKSGDFLPFWQPYVHISCLTRWCHGTGKLINKHGLDWHSMWLRKKDPTTPGEIHLL